MSEDIKREVLYIEDLAKLMGKSVSAIKNGLWDNVPWLPPHFKIGRRICWRPGTVQKFLEQQEQLSINPPRKRGRPRKTPPIV